jgi:lipopolysaccharide biosynthesis glycosyltransferase
MIFTAITNNAHAPGAYATINSLIQNSGIEDIKILLFRMGELSRAWSERLKGLGAEISDLGELGIFRYNSDLSMRRLAPSMQKLLLFKLPYEHEIAYIDSDIICLNDISMVGGFKHFTSTAVVGISIPGGVNCRPMFSGGFFVFKPGQFDEIQEYAIKRDGDLRLADQTLLNEFFYTKYPNDVHLLDFRFEMLKRIKTSFPKLWDLKRAKLLHYVGDKPWEKHQGTELQGVWNKYAWKQNTGIT